MAIADHCQKIMPPVTRDTRFLTVECPICFTVWIYEDKRWTQIPFNERDRQQVEVTGQ